MCLLMNICDMSLFKVMWSLTWLCVFDMIISAMWISMTNHACVVMDLWWFGSNCYVICFDFMHVCDLLIRVLVIKLLRLVKLLKSN